MEQVSGSRTKRDPAWKHCETISNGSKVQLKCIYCGKIFKGGGIYRIKKHLAGRKGDGVTCTRVQPDVRSRMLDCLNEISEKKSKQQKLQEGNNDGNNPGTSAEVLNSQSGQNAEIDLFSVDEIHYHDSGAYAHGEDGVNTISNGRKPEQSFRENLDLVECDVAVPLNIEMVMGTRPKRDLAWNHCKMFKSDGKVRLKCIYCGKIFKGGGIYRIKEHLAGQKGNGVTCTRVQPDVRLLMFESLNGISGGKRKKQKLLEFKISCDDPGTSGAEVLNNHCGSNAKLGLLSFNEILDNESSLNEIFGEGRDEDKLHEKKSGFDDQGASGVEMSKNTEFDILPMNELLGHDSSDCMSRKDGVSNKSGCTNLNKIIRKNVDDSNGTALATSQATNLKKTQSLVHTAVGRFFFDVGLSMDAVRSAYFQPMIDAIASQGRGVVGPSYNDLRNSILKNSVNEVREDVDQCRETWGRTGCSILVNEWNSVKGKTFVNFLVYCPQGTVFLRSADISNATNSTVVIHELMRETLEEVGVRNVLQVVTSCDDRYVTAGKKLMDTYPTVFWTPCAGHCIDMMLEDIGEHTWVKSILGQAKSISRYIYSNNVVLNMMRRYTSGVDLVDVGITRSSSDFMTLKQILNMRNNLQSMFTSVEWMECPYSKTQEGYTLLDYVSNETFWSTCALIIRLTDPLLRLLRIVGSGKMPAMGFVYAGLYRAKETIKKELVNEKEYLAYWNIIDHRWEQLQWHPLHAAGFYFNPKFFYSLQGDAIFHIRSLVYDCVEKVVLEPQIQDKIMKEIAYYQAGAGDFGRKMAIRARDTLLPTEWWSIYGGGCPNLTRLAICILSQSCSLIQYKLNKIPLELMHEWKNCLEHHRLSDLVFVQYNMSLKQMALRDKQQETVDPISCENIDIVGDWVTDKNVGVESLQTADWTAVDPPFGNVKLLCPQDDDIEALGSGFDDNEILNGVKDGEEVNGLFYRKLNSEPDLPN